MNRWIRGAGTLLFASLMILSLVFFFRHRQVSSIPAASPSLKEASFYQVLSEGNVQCFLCPRHCTLPKGRFGNCKARQNIGGKLYSAVYGKIAALHTDPIEKKPFFHVLPSGKAFSIASTGCNLGCLFCQNWEISQAFPEQVPTRDMTPQEVIREAKNAGAQSLAFTYNEPVINYEFMLETAKLAKENGLKTLVVSSGYIEPAPLRNLLKWIDAYKVDFKAMNDSFYRKLTGGRLAPVLETMKIIRQEGVWLEILNLIVPGQNDSDAEIRELARWIKENLGPDVPLHFSRFHPQYRLMNLAPTPAETLRRARAIALEEGLHFVYTGNIPNPEGEATYCPLSKEKVIERLGYIVLSNRLKNGECPNGEKIPGIWK